MALQKKIFTDIAFKPGFTTVNTPVETVREGQVKFFNDEKGYGFINDKATKESIFVHINNVEGELRENDRVTFEIENGPKGPNAVNVKLI